jgi:hypothetical protein
MAHIHYSPNGRGLADPAWFSVGRSIGELANAWAGRNDIVAYLGDEVSGGAPAAFNPKIAEVEVSTKQVFGSLTPDKIGDFTFASTRYEFPKATGAVIHEAFHARYSKWDLEEANKALKPDEFKAMMILEEGRIEAQGILDRPEGKNFLRACAMDLVIADSQEAFKTQPNTYSAGTLVALLHARIDAGILDESESEELIALVDKVLKPRVVEKLRAIARDFQAHTEHHNAEPLYPLAREWAKLIRESAEENGDPSPEEAEKNPQPASAEFTKAIMDAMEDMRAVVSITSNDDLMEQETEEKWKEQVQSKKDSAKEQNDAKETAKEVFNSKSNQGGGKPTKSRLQETRTPTTAERQGAVIIARMLEKAKYRERSQTEVNSSTPPGRLRTRALVQRNAMRARGVYAEVQPWRRTVRKHTDDPNLTVGVMVDISGSMNSAMLPMASTAWVLSEAVRRVQGRTAMVYYGSSVFPTLKPGEHLNEVKIYNANDNTEEFDTAFKALDGALSLLNGEGARLLVVVSDGAYRSDQRALAKKWVKRCAESGVAVLWMPFEGDYYVKGIVQNHGATVLGGRLDPASAASEIGKAASTALTNVGKRNTA